MKKGVIIGIVGIGVLAIILGIILTFDQKSDTVEVEDTFDSEIQPVENSEIQERLDEIERIADESDYSPLPREWITSGPFQIDRSKYAIGEKIFIRIGGLDFNAKGEIDVIRPINATHNLSYLTIPFDGAQKSGFNYYIEPQISKIRGICSVDDIMGKWTLVFRGTNYPNLDFEITEKIVPGTNMEPVC